MMDPLAELLVPPLPVADGKIKLGGADRYFLYRAPLLIANPKSQLITHHMLFAAFCPEETFKKVDDVVQRNVNGLLDSRGGVGGPRLRNCFQSLIAAKMHQVVSKCVGGIFRTIMGIASPFLEWPG